MNFFFYIDIRSLKFTHHQFAKDDTDEVRLEESIMISMMFPDPVQPLYELVSLFSYWMVVLHIVLNDAFKQFLFLSSKIHFCSNRNLG